VRCGGSALSQGTQSTLCMIPLAERGTIWFSGKPFQRWLYIGTSPLLKSTKHVSSDHTLSRPRDLWFIQIAKNFSYEDDEWLMNGFRESRWW
jgi:hypothetical protein